MLPCISRCNLYAPKHPHDQILVPEDKGLFLERTDVPLFMGRYTGETLILGALPVDVKQSQHASAWDQNNAV